MKPVERLRMIRKIKLSIDDSKIVKNDFQEGEMVNPCQSGYVAYGTKEKDGVTVPNCIPDPEEMKKVVKEGFPIPSPRSDESESDYMSRCISEISGEYEHEQSIAICIGKWQEK